MIQYDKLVRDKIPEIIEKSNKEYKIHIVNSEEAIAYLTKKFSEELNEFNEAYAKEELADILELIHGLAYQLDYDMKEIEAIRKEKYDKRGGFEKNIVLDYVMD